MKTNIITAKEARKMIEDNKVVWSEKDGTQLAEVMDMIRYAVNMGVYEIIYSMPLTDMVYAEVMRLGYQISSTRDITHTAYTISW